MFTGITGFEEDERDSPEKKEIRATYRTRYLREVERTFDHLFEMVDLVKGEGSAAALQHYKIPSIGFLLTSLSETLVHKVFNVNKEFAFEGHSH